MTLTNQQKLQAYRFVLKQLKHSSGEYSPLICLQLHSWLLYRYFTLHNETPAESTIRLFPEFMLKRPANAGPGGWWDLRDRQPRIKCLESLILELQNPQSNGTILGDAQ